MANLFNQVEQVKVGYKRQTIDDLRVTFKDMRECAVEIEREVLASVTLKMYADAG